MNKHRNAIHIRFLCQAIFTGALPESAIAWPILAVTRRTRPIGSGETTSWRTNCNITLDGKHVARIPIGEWSTINPSDYVKGKLHPIDSPRGIDLYAVEPC